MIQGIILFAERPAFMRGVHAVACEAGLGLVFDLHLGLDCGGSTPLFPGPA
jgi:hypothetical protein